MKNTTINVEEAIQTINKQNKRIEELCLEIERLNNIINEFEKWLKEMKKYYGVGYYDTSINKLQELKGSDKE